MKKIIFRETSKTTKKSGLIWKYLKSVNENKVISKWQIKKGSINRNVHEYLEI